MNGVFLVAKSQAVGNADTVRIGNDGGFLVDVAENQIGDLPSDAGQRQKLVHRVRNTTVKPITDHN